MSGKRRGRNFALAFVIEPRYSETGFKRKPIYNSKPQGFDQRKET
ncbi:Hypothetical protein RY67_2079 [Bifidobacterium longum subsp. infantis]|uniref:Uncharacterized protein n=1 Tax=Bifidobacterium longum subsp. infantis TaxID=1682 RepID=A0A0M4LWH3_BIFLI|nr:Hypothetical protein RY67_2079 [Bifidobacterium longum subsp. infantis]